MHHTGRSRRRTVHDRTDGTDIEILEVRCLRAYFLHSPFQHDFKDLSNTFCADVEAIGLNFVKRVGHNVIYHSDKRERAASSNINVFMAVQSLAFERTSRIQMVETGRQRRTRGNIVRQSASDRRSRGMR